MLLKAHSLFHRTNTTKAAAVAAASASAVAGAGPVAAAAAGAAAAAAVAAALGEESQELVPYHSSVILTEIDPARSSSKLKSLSRSLLTAQEEGSPMRIFERVRSLSPRAFSDAMFEGPQTATIRRSESLDTIQSASNFRPVRLVRSGSEQWDNGGDINFNGSDSPKFEYRKSHHRSNSFSEYTEHIEHETTKMRPSNYVAKSEAVACNGNFLSNSGAPVVKDIANSLSGQGNHKMDTAEGDTDTRVTLGRPRNGQLTNRYSLDVNRQQLMTRVGKPLNGKRLPERIVSLLPSATEILLEIGKLNAFSCPKPLRCVYGILAVEEVAEGPGEGNF